VNKDVYIKKVFYTIDSYDKHPSSGTATRPGHFPWTWPLGCHCLKRKQEAPLPRRAQRVRRAYFVYFRTGVFLGFADGGAEARPEGPRAGGGVLGERAASPLQARGSGGAL